MTNGQFTCSNTGRTFMFNSTRVILIDDGYDASEGDPIQGSEFGCGGLVIGYQDHEEYIIRVNWDNGCSNEYRPDDLDIIGHVNTMELNNPNRAFRLHKRTSVHDKAQDDFNKLKAVVDGTDALIKVCRKALEDADGDVDTAVALVKESTKKAEYADFLVTADTADFIKLSNKPITIDNTLSAHSIQKVIHILDVGVTQAKRLLDAHDGDADAAITYFNLTRERYGSDEPDITEEEQQANEEKAARLAAQYGTSHNGTESREKPSKFWSKIRMLETRGE